MAFNPSKKDGGSCGGAGYTTGGVTLPRITTPYFNREKLVQSFARAAEQLYHDQDPDGQKRQQFVQEQLRAMGVVITEAVINMIEGAVWEINTENKKALVQTKKIVSGGVE